MDTPENLLLTHRKGVISVLLNGKESATQLQTLLHNSSCGPHLLRPDELTLQILRSFTEALSQLKNCGPPLILPVSGHRKSKEPAKASRGCYKRRKCSDSRITVSETMEDDHAWRKYGQKRILNSIYPRCYFRCTHKNSQGCKAIKQVQRISEDEYNITYFGQHTCTKDSIIRAPVLVIKSSSISDMVSFECSTQEEEEDVEGFKDHDDTQTTITTTITGVSETKSSYGNAWDNDQCMSSGWSGTGVDVDDSCFANLDNLFRSEEMRLLDY